MPANPTSAPVVSVVVPVHNDARRLANLLSCLEQQTAPRSSFEVLVVDDRSTDDTPQIVRDSGFARLLQAPDRGGSYRARNIGIAEAKADILAFTDSDCAPAASWIEHGIRAMSGDADRVAGRIEVPLGDSPSAAAMLDAALHLNQRRYVDFGFAATANVWIRRTVFDSVGRFNEELQSGGDKEFGLRAGRAGVSLGYDGEVRVTHPPRTRLRELARKSYRLGAGAALHNFRGTGPVADRDAAWSHLRSYLPARHPLLTPERLVECGIPPTDAVLRRLQGANYVSIRLPYAVGGLIVGLRHERWAAVRRLLLERAPT